MAAGRYVQVCLAAASHIAALLSMSILLRCLRCPPAHSAAIYSLSFWYAGQLVGSGENTLEEVLKVGNC